MVVLVYIFNGLNMGKLVTFNGLKQKNKKVLLALLQESRVDTTNFTVTFFQTRLTFIN